MVDIVEHYVLLEQDAARVAGTQILTRPVGIEIGGIDVFAGVDSAGLKHLLLPAHGEFSADSRSRGVVLAARPLVVDGITHAFADLHCMDKALGLVFDRLAEDVLDRVNKGSDAVMACHAALDDWRSMLEIARNPVSRETAIGLTGELEVLKRIGAKDPVSAVESWRGPTRTVHDFVHGGHAIEVKATTSVDGNTVSISNTDQLDARGLTTLHLAVIHCRLDDAAPSLDDRVQELLDNGYPRKLLLDALSESDYVFESGLGLPRYAVRSVRVWQVDDAFPGIRPGDVDSKRLKGVSRLRYDLLLDAAPSRLDDAAASALLDSWLTR